MKLTTSIIESAPIILDPNKQPTLQLRGMDLTDVDGLPTNFSAVDLSNNLLIELRPHTIIPIETLLINNNHELYMLDSSKFPKLRNLSVNHCNFKLNHMKSWNFPLENLIILNNPVSNIKNYRLILIHLLPTLISLDCQKVKQSEREASKRMFEGKTIDDFVDLKVDSRKLIEQLKKSTDIKEIERLERILASN